MKKLFTLFAAVLVAVAVNAKTTIVDPGAGTLSAAISAASDNDVLILDGEYTESSTTSIQKILTIKAAEGKKPVVKHSKYFRVYQNLVWDGVNIESLAPAGSGYGFYIHETCQTLTVKNCEMSGCHNGCVTSWLDIHLTNLTIDNCYFHNNIQSVVYLPGAGSSITYGTCDNTVITNSTFANNDGSSWSAGLIDIRKSSDPDLAQHKLTVDHCTFVNNISNGSGYGDIYPRGSEDIHVSNCIFAHFDETGYVATRLVKDGVGGGDITNCITFGYSEKSSSFGHYPGDKVSITGCWSEDPKFVDAANSDFCLKAASPAIGAGTDKSNLGDPRWGVAKTLYCKMEHGWWTADGAAVGCYAKVDGGAQMSDWPGTLMTSLGDNLWQIEISAKYNKINFTRVKGDGSEYWGAKTAELNVPVNSNLYTIAADQLWDPSEAKGSWSVKDAKYYIAGNLTDWDNDKIGATADEHVLKLAAGKYQIKVVGKDWYGLNKLTSVAQGLYPDQDGNICFILAEAGDVTINFVEAEEITTFTVAGAFALPSVKLIGQGEVFGAWEAENAVAFTPDEGNLTASHTFTLAAGDYEFKMIRADEWLTVEGEDGEHNKTVYGLHRDWTSVGGFYRDDSYYPLKITADVAGDYKFTWTYATGTLNITFPAKTPTAIDNTAVEGKAVKMIENGQIVILKNGVRYNVLGAQIK